MEFNTIGFISLCPLSSTGMVIGSLACVSSGAAIVLPSEGFDAAATLQTVAQHKCTALYGVVCYECYRCMNDDGLGVGGSRRKAEAWEE